MSSRGKIALATLTDERLTAQAAEMERIREIEAGYSDVIDALAAVGVNPKRLTAMIRDFTRAISPRR